jgi:hypothetical protein
MDIKFTIPDNKVQLIIDAICKHYGYQDTIQDPKNPQSKIANPETKQQFTKRMTIAFWKEHLETYEKETVLKTAENSFSKTVIDIT